MLILFDVDGTLTPSRGRVDSDFKAWLMNECKFEWRLITGSDPDKTKEQVGDDLWAHSVSYNCAGNHVFVRGVEVYKSTWHIPNDLEVWLEQQIISSKYKTQTGKHIEHRVGLCNFSVVGRNATPAQRKDYFEWDGKNTERSKLAEMINLAWPTVEAAVAGETGIDIYQRGTGKEQILTQVAGCEPIHFFGDKQLLGGNDYSLAQAILKNNMGHCYNVRDWEETFEILKSLNNQ